MSLRLAVIGDLHFPRLRNHLESVVARRDEFYRTLLTQFFIHPADLHVVLGDVTHEGTKEEWTAVYSLLTSLANKYNRQFHILLGNHDTLAFSKKEIEEHTGMPRYTFHDTSSCRLLLLDTTKEATPANWGGLIDDQELEWLAGLPAPTANCTLVFGHHPFPNTTAESEIPMMSAENAHALVPLVHSNRVVYFNGHNHVNSITTGSGDLSHWTFVQAASVLCSPSFRVVEVSDDEISVSTVFVDGPTLYEDAQAVRGALTGYAHKPLAKGQTVDHDIRLPLS